MCDPIISVCMPSYNGEKYIEKAIQSVLIQTYDDFELLIIDDASTDKTIDIIRSFTDKRIKLIENEINIGMVQNWNKCLDHSKGEYILLLCCDDYIEPDCLEKKINAFKYDKKISLVFSASYVINGNGKIIAKKRPFNTDRLFDGIRLARKSFICRNLFGEPSNVMFKKEVINKVGYFDCRLCYSPDWNYWIKLCMIGKAYYLNDYLMYYRISSTSVTSSLLKNSKKFIQDDKQFIKSCLEYESFILSKFEILIHKICIYIRTYVRKIFIILFT